MNTVQEYRNPILIGVAGLVLIIIVWSAWVSPQAAKLSSKNAQVQQAQTNVNNLQAQLTALKSERETLKTSACNDLSKSEAQIPSVQNAGDLEAQTTSFLANLTDLMKSSGVIPSVLSANASSASSSSTSTSTGVVVVPVTLSVSGSYAQMSAFISGLDSSFPRIFTISTFTLTLGAASSTSSTNSSSSSSSGGSDNAAALWVGGITTDPSAPFGLSIGGSIYYTTAPNGDKICSQASKLA